MILRRAFLQAPALLTLATTTTAPRSTGAFVSALTIPPHGSSGTTSPAISSHHKQNHRLFSSSFANSDDIQDWLESHPESIVLDVRGADEILQSGHLHLPGHRWVMLPVTPVDATLLEQTALDLLPSKRTAILVHCASGKRATKAKQVLDAMGYETVVNAGGWNAVEPLSQ